MTSDPPAGAVGGDVHAVSAGAAVAVDPGTVAGLVEEDPEILVTIDLLENKVTAADMDFRAALPDHAREALVRGKWDAIAELLENIPDVERVAGALPYFKTA